MNDSRRITLISRNPRNPQRSWNHSSTAPSRIVQVDSFAVLRYSMDGGIADMDLDVERIILDRTTTSCEFLSFLARLPQEYRGDVLYVRDDESGFMSSAGRGGDRVLYSLSAVDLDFYFATHDLLGSEPSTTVVAPLFTKPENEQRSARAV